MSSSPDSSYTIHISLGCDCACAYQMRKYSVNQSAYPFDWVKCDNIKMICETLDNGFSNFFENYQLIEQNDKFDKFDKFDNFDKFNNFDKFDNDKIKSRVKIKLKNNMVLPHEAKNFDFDVSKYNDKYRRRIDRFNKVVNDKDIKKIFIRCDNKKIKDTEKELLIKSLNDYGCINYDIIFINYSDFICVDEFTWKRDYIDWKVFLS